MKTKQNKTNPRRILGYLMALVMVLFTNVDALAQNTATIGSGTTATTSTGNDPIDGYYSSFRYQVVYTAAELTAAGMSAGSSISALGFSISVDYGGGNLNGYTIKMGHTTETSSAAHNASTTTTVKGSFAYNPTATAEGAFDMITFDASFVWDGTSNILIDICSSGPNAYTSPYGSVRTIATSTTNGSRFKRSDSSNQCGVNTSSANSTKPQISFTYTPPAAGQGCMDPTACNYDAAATTAGSCNDDLGCGCNGTVANPAAGANQDCAGNCTNGGVAVVYTPGSYAYENSFTITDCDGAVLASMSSGTVGFNDPCVVLPAIYSVNLTDSYGDGWGGGTLTVNGVVYTQTGANAAGVAQVFQVGACPVYGCTDPTAANYNAAADTDDGTCTYGIPGCTDVAACNYDGAATANDGSCTYAVAPFDCAGSCANGGTFMDINVREQSSGGYQYTLTGWGGSWSLTDVATGNTFDTSTDDVNDCLPDGCYEISGISGSGGSYAFIYSIDGGATYTMPGSAGAVGTDLFAVGTGVCPVLGCTDSTATNYNAAANSDDGSCTYPCLFDEVTITLTDSYGDTWNGGSLTVNGVVYTQPTTSGVFGASPTSDSYTVCLDLSVCTPVTYTAGGFSSENSWSITDASGAVIASGGNASGTVGTCISGCMTVGDCAYNPLANVQDAAACVGVPSTTASACESCVNGALQDLSDDLGCGCGNPAAAANADCSGACLAGYVSVNGACVAIVNGCTDPTATNYNALANTDDGSCITTATLNMNVFLDGYYVAGSNPAVMTAARYLNLVASGSANPGANTDVDLITVQLRSATNTETIVHTVTPMLQSNGNAVCVFPGSAVGQSYYVVVDHRASNPLWSATPITITSSSTYNMANALANAYSDGNTAIQPMDAITSGLYGIWMGELNEDGYLDGADYSLFEIQTNAAQYQNQYLLDGDFNGDTYVDASDFAVFDSNSNYGAYEQRPY